MNVVLEKTIYDRAPARFDAAAEKHGFEWCLIQPLEEEKALAFHEEGADVFIIGTKKYSGSFYHALHPGTLIPRFGVGYGSVPVGLCRERGIRVGYAPGMLDPSVAEHAIGLMLSLSRNLCSFDRDMRAGKWNPITGRELCGKTLAYLR